MTNSMLDREAAELLTSIGVAIERWILNHARSIADSRPDKQGEAIVRRDDIKKSLQAFTQTGLAEFEGMLQPSKIGKSAGDAVRVG